MYTIHYLRPEQKFGVFEDGWFVKAFDTIEEAEEWIERQGKS